MEDIRTHLDDEEPFNADEERPEWIAAGTDDEPPFHVPRD
jgi:hypothetical protein